MTTSDEIAKTEEGGDAEKEESKVEITDQTLMIDDSEVLVTEREDIPLEELYLYDLRLISDLAKYILIQNSNELLK